MATAGEPTRREALRRRAVDLRAEGLTYARISTELGISVPYANELVRNPEGWRGRRTRPALTGPQGGEIGAGKMAKLISDEVGFAVDSDRVKWAAREGKIPSRRGARGRRYFGPAQVLAAIRAGTWRPHRPGTSEERTCGNRRCTKGPDGTRQRKRVPASQLERLRDDESPWTCSRECTAAVMSARDRDRGRTLTRQCGCRLEDGSPCPNFVRVTLREVEGGTGPKRCDRCKEAGRRTEAQRASARAALAATQAGSAAQAHRAALATKNGQRNRRSPDRMDKLIEGRMRAHGKPYTDEMRKSVRGRALSRAQRDSGRSHKTREMEVRVRELWTEGLTAEQIAERLQGDDWGRVTARYIWKLRERLNLPRRKPGPRPKSS